jgi:integrase
VADRVEKLTKRALDGFVTTGGRYTVWDSELKGFGVRVEASGRKTFLVRYRTEGGGRRAPLRQVSLGAFGPLTPDQARNLAKDALAAVRHGGDPAQERRKKRAAPDMHEAVRFYLEDYARAAKLAPSTIRDARSVLEKYALPVIGKVKVAELTTADIRRLHRAAFDASSSYQANKMVRFLSKAISLAVEAGQRADNPCRAVKSFSEEKRERYLSEDEAGRFLAALDLYPDQQAANALRLLLFTGARLREVIHAAWGQFDLDTGVWTKPSAHTKQKRTHRFDLAGPALDVLREMRKVDPFGLVLFPGKDPNVPRADLNRPWRWVKREAGLERIRLHDLRHSLASFMVAEGASLSVIGRALGHTQVQTTARYAHVADQTQRNATAAVGAKLVELGRRPVAQVLEMPKP